ncbi:MAG: UvrD-helicase domain-containing protein [Desulfovibrio sp.]|nr:UvrD-helicase domain-containing protein [Desulfovibrio sp.]
MPFVADLHIHSRFSRATSKALTPRHLAAWAMCKGIAVLGTGDFTHPQWRAELREQLEPDAPSGLYRLKGQPDPLPFLAEGEDNRAPAPLFCLQGEISSIYKRHGKVRKVHNLVYVSSLEDAERLSQRLAQIGNLNADGRPILGLDSRDLLEITLETAPDAVLIPAHIWTPWFALFGSKSGFDRMEDCFGDLTPHIFAVETGLSSDPAMNRMVSQLDGYALVSNSDAHSGANLGREGNLFAGQPSYNGIFTALRTAARRQPQDGLDCRFLGTLEFYPEEGKYHLDGHRACQVVLEPQQARAMGDMCPVCGKPLTIGVLHRVLELADRDAPATLPLEPEARPLIPLPEILGEILGVGAGSRKVQDHYARLLRELGPELDILCTLPEEQIRPVWDELGEAVARMRRGQVFRQGGYDGEYGTVKVFAPGELAGRGSSRLPGLAGASASRSDAAASKKRGRPPKAAPQAVPAQTLPLDGGMSRPTANMATRAAATITAEQPSPIRYSTEQLAALQAGPGPVLVAAGPGAGKTRILVGRLQWLLEQGQPANSLLAVTFTRRAAAEMRQRLAKALPDLAGLPQCDTLHGLAWGLLREARPGCRLLDDDAAFRLFCAAQEEAAPKPAYSSAPLLASLLNGNTATDQRTLRQYWEALQLARELDTPLPKGSPAAHAAARYAARKTADADSPWLDYGDLLDGLLELAPSLRGRWRHILLDEAQDISPKQAAILRALLPEDGTGFFGIGDPDQAIYAFRGASGHSEEQWRTCWPGLHLCRLGQSYRASQGVLDMAHSLLQGQGHCGPLLAVKERPALLRLFVAPDEQAEARWLAGRIQRLLGASSHSLLDRQAIQADSADALLDGQLAPADIAVLVRLKAQIPPLLAALEQAGIPCAAPARQDFRQDPVCAHFLALIATTCGFAEALPRVEQGSMDQSSLPWAAADLPKPQAMQVWLQSQPWAGADATLFCKGQAWRELCRLWAECGGWRPFLERLAWLREAEMIQAKAERVQLLTLHASKGLEFQAVFLPGLESGLLPLRRELLWEAAPKGREQGGQRAHADATVDSDTATDSSPAAQEAALAEERRLLYVGLTRAARGLFISHCTRRNLYGRTLHLAPSPFLGDIRQFCRQSTLTAHKRTTGQHLSLMQGLLPEPVKGTKR